MTDQYVAKGEINNNSRTTILDSSTDLSGMASGDTGQSHIHLYNRDVSADIEVTIEMSDDNGTSWSEFDEIPLSPKQREVTAIPLPIAFGFDVAVTSDHASGYLNWMVDARKDA
jgi:hypothetical protein